MVKHLIKKVDHIGILVENLDDALKTYTEILGLKVAKTIELKEANLRLALLNVGGLQIELMQPTDGKLGEYLAQRGPGIHHIAFMVADIENALEKVKKEGIKLLDEKPRPGLTGRIAYMDSKSTHGALLQFVEK